MPTTCPQAMRQATRRRGPRPEGHFGANDHHALALLPEHPGPGSAEAVARAMARCRIDPRATRRSNQARLLFALYEETDLPFPRGWRGLCVAALAGVGVPATERELDMLATAMDSDACIEFDGWPGIDPILVSRLASRG